MSQVYKSLDLVGTSNESFEEAVRTAVARAGQTMRNLQWFEVIEERGYIRDGQVHEYQVKLRVWFALEESQGG